jgi:hypothetical protein
VFVNPPTADRGNAEFHRASAYLSRFVRAQAAATSQLVGFGWVPSPTAPADFPSLQRAYWKSCLSGRPLSVSDQHCEGTIYAGRDANLAFRFWHDLTHVALEAGFDLDGELAVASAQLDVLQAAGRGPASLEYVMLHHDTIGQTICSAVAGDFPEEQACFVRRCITESLGQTVRDQVFGRWNGFTKVTS